MVSRCSQAPETPLSTICYGNSYHGVGHGTAGLVLALLRYPYLTTLHAPTIHVTLAHLLEVRLPNGNWPKGPTDAHGALVHWCHGAPGMAILFAIAARAFPEREEYLRAALAAGDVTWERGLLRKGIGLCHGVCGNAYAFLYLHEVTREERWLWRAARFADFATEWEALEEQGTMKHEDMPWSLFDGATGAIVFWADLLSVAEGKGMVGFPFCFESVSP
ncbi:hypothetical protein BC830DRAFT_1061133 [Chytriomyces sp. MP71]|nr:hypothetical protein BC830DRAFT_1061133 [Chytriomyces sp. MP71]